MLTRIGVWGRELSAVWLSLLVLLSSLPVQAAAPRVGLVLGGGGARGFAHLGVLEELERLHVPISCIAGTSAGALIGGLYASGMSVDEMKKTFAATDWDALLAGGSRRVDVPFQRKRDDYNNYIDMTLGVDLKSGIKVPRSAINSQAIDLFIRQLTRSRSLDSFDQLPVPFRAVATDLETGEAVVFDRGELATALRSSMAVPGVFDLVETDGRLLVDGMLARNLPVSEAKSCADVLIVVDVGAPLLKKDEIRSMLDVLNQTTNLVTAANVREQMRLLGPRDIVIRPNLGDYSPGDFRDYSKAMEQGRQAAAGLRDKLATLSQPQQDYLAWQQRMVRIPEPTVERVEVAGNYRYVNPRVLTERLEVKEPAQTESELQGKISRLFAEEDYERIAYTLDERDGETVATVNPEERSIGPNYLRFGLTMKGATGEDSSFSMLVGHTRTWINSAGAMWNNQLRLGQEVRLTSEFQQPFSASSPWFGVAGVTASREPVPLYDFDHNRISDIDMRSYGAALGLGLRLGRYGEARSSVFFGQREMSDWSGLPVIGAAGGKELEKVVGARLSVVVDQLDRPRWPRSGYIASAEYTKARSLPGADESEAGVMHSGGKVSASYVKTLGEVTMRLSGSYIQPLNDSSDFARAGGFLSLSGFRSGELLSTEPMTQLRLMSYWRVASLPPMLGSGVYLGGSLEAVRVKDRLVIPYGMDEENVEMLRPGWLYGGSLFAAADTLIGPLFLGLGYSAKGKAIGYFYLGTDY